VATEAKAGAQGVAAALPPPAHVPPVLLERAFDLITVTDLDGTITLASPSWRQLGWKPEELLGRNVIDLVHPYDVAHATEKMSEVVAAGSVTGVAARIQRADGRYASVEASGVVLHDGDGHPIALLGTARDLTDREELRGRLGQLAAVNRIADVVARAATIDELLKEAVDALIEATGASRASVLLADEQQVMRFRAWRGLSDGYRAATDGHSPWPPDAEDPQPVLVGDAETAGFEEGLAETVRREGIRALAFIPLVHQRRLLGKFMLYHDEPHEWAETEVRLCQTIANHLASSATRFQTQDRLRESLAQIDAILDGAPTGIAFCDSELRFVRVNDALLGPSGMRQDDLVGRHIWDVFAEYEEELGPVLQRVLETGEPALDLEVKVKHAESRYVRISYFPVRDAAGTVLGTGVVTADVSAERQAQLEAERRAHAAEALDFVADGVVLVDEDGAVRLWNPAAAAITRIATADAVGRRLFDLLPDWQEIATRVAGDAGVATYPVTVAGEERWLSMSGVRSPGGTVYAFRDVTDVQRMERLKTEFVSTVSHELRTPLAAVYGAAQTLQRSDVRLQKKRREELLDMIASEGSRLSRIVDDILLASRLDANGERLRIERCDPAALAEHVVTAVGSYAPASIELAVKIADGLPHIAVDPDKIRQVLTNLLDNAVKYSPEGGRVELTASQAGDRLRFSVTDTGLGIPAGEQERIWEKFYRLDPNLTRGVGGTGLGLYICSELVERMNGRIWVESDGESGSQFFVELPLA